jgi:hypothetical protein
MLQWTDSRLVWNATEYNGQWALPINTSSVWAPKLTILNPADRHVNHPISAEVVWIQPNGSISTSLVSQFTSACELDLSDFPFDTQECYIKLSDMDYWSIALQYVVISDTISTGK